MITISSFYLKINNKAIDENVVPNESILFFYFL